MYNTIYDEIIRTEDIAGLSDVEYDLAVFFDKKIKGFADEDNILTGVETRSSSPVTILRNPETLMANVEGIYPCGEGAGYAGGITSAAVDGIKCAENILKRLTNEQQNNKI